MRPGDVLVLTTKRLGTGVLFNACRSKRLPAAELEALLPEVAALNRTALEVALQFELHACTDITGFGILGHTLEMARGSGVRIDLILPLCPSTPMLSAMYRKGETTGSNKANRQLVESELHLLAALSPAEQELLFDPQTCGGLLYRFHPNRASNSRHGLGGRGRACRYCGSSGGKSGARDSGHLNQERFARLVRRDFVSPRTHPPKTMICSY